MAFTIKINGGKDVLSSSVVGEGSESAIITDDAAIYFDITTDKLKEKVKQFLGKKPSDVFVKSPTPWGDLYVKDSLQQVTIVREIISARIVDLDMKPTIVSESIFQNDSKQIAIVNCKITDTVTNSCETNWSDTLTLGVTQTLKYNCSFLGAGGGGETAFSFSQEWAKGGSESKQTTVGSESGVQVELEPGEKVKAILSASRGTLKVEITYRTKLTGTVIANYSKRYQDHHFHYIDAVSLIDRTGGSYEYKTTEIISVGYYAESNVKVVEVNGKVKKSKKIDLAW
jgi:hypothetical protein